ncbi:MAG: hypothetical protein J6R41_10540 [Paludibacteraceae bacterium]|nr:hypothetical protein [Paludibacteraceae bacterium]
MRIELINKSFYGSFAFDVTIYGAWLIVFSWLCANYCALNLVGAVFWGIFAVPPFLIVLQWIYLLVRFRGACLDISGDEIAYFFDRNHSVSFNVKDVKVIMMYSMIMSKTGFEHLYELYIDGYKEPLYLYAEKSLLRHLKCAKTVVGEKEGFVPFFRAKWRTWHR